MKTNKTNTRLKELALAFGIGFSVALAAFSGVTYWLDRHVVIFRSPVVIQNKNEIKAVPTKTLTPTPDLTKSPISPVKPQSRINIVPRAYASENTQKVEAIAKEYPYQSKTSLMSDGQFAVMKKVESQLGHGYAELIFRESGFHPTSVNSIGACGLGQALPCSKMACELTDVDCQLEWVRTYVERRYGTIEKALEFHDIHNWY